MSTHHSAMWSAAVVGARLGLLGGLALISVIGILPTTLIAARGGLSTGEAAAAAGFTLVLLAVTMPPAILGGMANALLMYAVARRRKLTLVSALLIGGLLGILWAYMALVLLVVCLVVVGLQRPEPLAEWWTWAALAVFTPIGVPVGCWHAWRMLRYRQRERRGTDSGQDHSAT